MFQGRNEMNKQQAQMRLDVVKKVSGIADYSAYQMTVLMRKVYPDEYQHKELLEFILSTNYEAKRSAVLERKLTMIKNGTSPSMQSLRKKAKGLIWVSTKKWIKLYQKGIGQSMI